ncbi:MAG: hypothetical protein C0401_11305 [Anaerolinea sp.]|nr:hypothetical protein [Anaerolinea sp.]
MSATRKIFLNFLSGFAAAVVVVIAALLIFRGILFDQPGNALPWGSDTLGHVARVDFLIDSLRSGYLYPELNPHWYLGTQLFRYYSPLPYYILAGMTWLAGSSVTAANVFLFVCALAGGLSLLLYRRWLGTWLSLGGAALYLTLPENLRVAFSEGNLPRAGAFALLPLLIFFMLRSSEKTGRWWHRAGIAGTIFLVVFNHAMMGAIYAGFLGVLILMIAVIRGATWRQSLLALGSLVIGILLSGFWLIPSFTGGITELSSSAVAQGLTTEQLSTLLNPWLRSGNLEITYAGLVLFIGGVLGLIFRAGRNRFTSLFTITGLLGVLAMTPGMFNIISAFPGISLLWPARFLGISTFLILLSLLWSARLLLKKAPLVSFAIIILLALDFFPSLRLVFLRPVNHDLVVSSQQMALSQGWREATLDKSRLGSAATYLIGAENQREQLFGWAYQGARTAANLAGLNDAIDLGALSYMQDRLNLFGVDDIVIEPGINRKIDLESGLLAAGFSKTFTGGTLASYHRDGSPRAVIADWEGLGIGRGASTYALLFPRVILGNSHFVDDYSLSDLLRFKKVILAGFTWRDKQTAEDLIRQAAGNGVDVIVDLTQSREDPLARIPQFLGVWGEPLILNTDPVTASRFDDTIQIFPFGEPGKLWHTHSVQGLQTQEVIFKYLGQPTAIAGYNQIDGNKIWFIGLNLVYHTALTRDPVSQELLASIIGIAPEEVSEYVPVALENYSADARGYRFNLTVEAAERILIPVAAHEGTVVEIDGVNIEHTSYENMVVIDVPAGQHSVEIRLKQTKVYQIGVIVSLLGLIGLVILIWADRRKPVRKTDRGGVK